MADDYKINSTTGDLDKVRSDDDLDGIYLRLDATNDPITGNLSTSSILPRTDSIYNIGSSTGPLRYANVFSDVGTFGATRTAEIGDVSYGFNDYAGIFDGGNGVALLGGATYLITDSNDSFWIDNSGQCSFDTIYWDSGLYGTYISATQLLISDWIKMGDNDKHYFGQGDDASIYFDGSDMVFDSQEVGTGDFYFANGNVGIGTTDPLGILHVATDYYRPFFFGEVDNAVVKYSSFVGTHYNTVETEGVFFLGGVNTGFYNRMLIGGGRAEHNAMSELYFFTAPNIATRTGTLRMIIGSDGNVALQEDNQKLLFGAAQDASIYYTGSHLIIDPQEVGDGNIGIGSEMTPAKRLHVMGMDSTDHIQTDAGINFSLVSIASAPTATLDGAGNIDEGNHRYMVTYVTGVGETSSGTPSNTITAIVGGSKVQLTNISTSSDYRVTARKIYRTIAGTAAQQLYYFKLLTTINDNTTTTYEDNTADADLGDTGAYPGAYYRPNTTNDFLVINDTPAMILTNFNTVFGQGIWENWTTGTGNTGFGVDSFEDLTTGSGNSTFGNATGRDITTGVSNSLFGNTVGRLIDTGGYNTLMGQYNLYNTDIGIHNTSVGWSSLRFGTSSVSYNTALGSGSGYNVDGSYNLFLGYQAGYNASGNYLIYIDTSNTTTPLIYGETNNRILRFGEDSTYTKWGTAGDMGIKYDGTYGYIETDLVGASDLKVDCGANKTIELVETVWDDLPPMPVLVAKLGATAPTLATAPNGTNVKQYTFGVGDIIYGSTEITHKYKEGTDITAHIHWLNNGSDGAVSKYVEWQLSYQILKANEGAGSEVVISSGDLEIPALQADGTHYISSLGTAITGTNLDIGDYIIWELERIASDGDAPAANPFGIAVGFHVQCDTMGSRQETAK